MAIYVPLRADVREALRDLARREDRDPRHLAARLIEDGLIELGLLAPREEREESQG